MFNFKRPQRIAAVADKLLNQIYTQRPQPTNDDAASANNNTLKTRASEYLKTGRIESFSLATVTNHTFESVTHSDAFIAQGSYKVVYASSNEKYVTIVPNLDNRNLGLSFDEFLTEAASQVLIYELWKEELWDSLSPEKRLHYAKIPKIKSIHLLTSRTLNKSIPVIVMERLESNLETHMSVDGVSMDKRADFCIALYQITRTIQWLHKRCAFIHGDLKINNVAVTYLDECPRIHACLIDFGLSSFQIGSVVRTSPVRYVDINSKKKAPGMHGNNDILFFLLTSYTAWSDYLGYDRYQISSILDAYVFYIVDNLWSRIERNLQGIKSVYPAHYSAYNPSTAGKYLNGSVQYDIVRFILSSYKTNECVNKLLHDTEVDLDMYESYQKENERQRVLIQRLEAHKAAMEQTHRETLEAVERERSIHREALERKDVQLSEKSRLLDSKERELVRARQEVEDLRSRFMSEIKGIVEDKDKTEAEKNAAVMRARDEVRLALQEYQIRIESMENEHARALAHANETVRQLQEELQRMRGDASPSDVVELQRDVRQMHDILASAPNDQQEQDKQRREQLIQRARAMIEQGRRRRAIGKE